MMATSSAAIPTLGTFAFAAMRLLPALQGIYQGLSSIRGGTAVLDKVFDEHSETFAIVDAVQHRKADSPALALTRDLELRGVEYAYEGGTKAAVHDLDMRIAARTTIGIVGGTGAGKTTLVDLILGLLSPQKGAILVDGVPIDPQNVRAWQKTLGYVPQQIYLSDDTVACNIAFGVPPAQIDMAAVERAARIAALHDFVTSDLPKGYDTLVGERGVRLSGGQRQRIGIARALYTNPSLLIMDEATSALDTITERVVMEAVQNIRKDKTIIMIAHRLSTVRNCDRDFPARRRQDRGELAPMTNLSPPAPPSSAWSRVDMRITFVSPPPKLNGGTRVIATYADRLQALAHDVLSLHNSDQAIARVNSSRLSRGAVYYASTTARRTSTI